MPHEVVVLIVAASLKTLPLTSLSVSKVKVAKGGRGSVLCIQQVKVAKGRRGSVLCIQQVKVAKGGRGSVLCIQPPYTPTPHPSRPVIIVPCSSSLMEE
jgi:hypothetical protein